MGLTIEQLDGIDFTCANCPAARAITSLGDLLIQSDVSQELINSGMSQVKLAAYALNKAAVRNSCVNIADKILPNAMDAVPLPLTQDRVDFVAMCPATKVVMAN